MRRQYCHPSTFLYYREPLMLVEGYMQYLYDETGRRYLDMFAGIVTVRANASNATSPIFNFPPPSALIADSGGAGFPCPGPSRGVNFPDGLMLPFVPSTRSKFITTY